MKLDANMLRYLSKEDFRVLTAVEMGQKNHEIVPVQLVSSISGLRHGGSFKVLRTLLRHKLLHHENLKYDGYRLTTLGYDYLALRALCARGVITGVGRQIGVGKESDVYEVVDEDGNLRVCKFHRLGRTSFRAVKSKRDYLKHRKNYSWLYLSRLAALKEFAFMRALSENGLPVPEAVDQNRHCVVMSVAKGKPLSQMIRFKDPGKVYKQITENMVSMAKLGLVHCDFNEFNIMVDEKEDITVIDFPQMVSVKHENASHLFQRDVDCILRFFNRKVKYSPDEEELGSMVAYPTLEDVLENMNLDEDLALDKQLAASGFKRRLQEENEEEGNSGSDDESGEYTLSETDYDFVEEKDNVKKVVDEVSKAEGQLQGMSIGEGEEGVGGGDLDGLLSFAAGYESGSQNDDAALGGGAPESGAKPLKRTSNRGGYSGRGRKGYGAKNKGKSNANKDKSGRRHDGVKHKFSKSSDY
jgi:RIO kinase 2